MNAVLLPSAVLLIAMIIAMMPNRGRGGKGRRKARPQGRRAGRGGGILSVPRGINVMPNVMRTHFEYNVTYRTTVTGITLSPSTVYFQFAANGMYNPDLNVSLENFPTGLAQMGQIYERYQVVGSQCQVQITMTQGIPVTNVRAIIWPHQYSQAVGATATVDDFSGQPNAGRIFMAGPVSGLSHGQSSQSRTTAYMLSRPEAQVRCAPDTSGIIYTSNPATLWYWTVVISNENLAAVALPDVQVSFRITYLANLFGQAVFDPTNNALRNRRASHDSVVLVEEKEG